MKEGLRVLMALSNVEITISLLKKTSETNTAYVFFEEGSLC